MTNKQGRRPGYTSEQLARAVAQAEAAYGAPTPSQVKTTLCKLFGIQSTLNDASFQGALSQFYSDREAARQQAVIAGLPEHVRKSAVREIRGSLEHAILVLLGEGFAAVQADAQRRVAEAEHLTRDVTFKLRHLEVTTAEQDQTIADLAAERDAAHARIGELEQVLTDRAVQKDMEVRLLEAFGRFLDERTLGPQQAAQLTALSTSGACRAG